MRISLIGQMGTALLVLECMAAQTVPQTPPPRGLVPRAELPGEVRDNANFRTTYLIGTNDVLQIRIPESEEVNDKTFRVESDGAVILPLVGRVRASGMTIEAFEEVLMKEIQPYIKASRVTVSLAQFRTEVVYLLGAFKAPGAHPLQEHRRLVDVVALAGGLGPSASRRLRLTRRLSSGPIPLPSAIVDPERNVTSAEIVLTSLMDTQEPAENVLLMPFDTITALRNEMVYISGEIAKPGAYELNDRDCITITQALALAGGLSRDARPERARILRPVMDSNRRAEIPIDLNRVLSGTANDFPLMANDALYVPRANQKKNVLGQLLMYTIPAVAVALIVSVIQ